MRSSSHLYTREVALYLPYTGNVSGIQTTRIYLNAGSVKQLSAVCINVTLSVHLDLSSSRYMVKRL